MAIFLICSCIGKAPQSRKIKRRALLPVEDLVLCQIFVDLASIYWLTAEKCLNTVPPQNPATFDNLNPDLVSFFDMEHFRQRLRQDYLAIIDMVPVMLNHRDRDVFADSGSDIG